MGLLPDLAGEIGDAEGAVGLGVRARLVGAESERTTAVRGVDVRVVGGEAVAVGVEAVIGAAGGALPLALVAEARSGEARGAIEPGGVGLAVDERDPGDREAAPVLSGARGALEIADELTLPRRYRCVRWGGARAASRPRPG